MIADAIVKVRNLDKHTKRIEVFSKKYANGTPLALLNSKYEGQPIKLITSWMDLPIKMPLEEGYGVLCVNGSVIPNNVVGKNEIARGSYVTCFGDDTIYVVVAEVMIK